MNETAILTTPNDGAERIGRTICIFLRVRDTAKSDNGAPVKTVPAGVIAVRTSKTGKAVEIPVFKPLREVLETALADKGESPFVWPEAAYMYPLSRQPDRNAATEKGSCLHHCLAGTPCGAHGRPLHSAPASQLKRSSWLQDTAQPTRF